MQQSRENYLPDPANYDTVFVSVMKFARLFLLTVFTASPLLAAHVAAVAKDEWIQVRSKNFFLIGNAPEKDIRKVGTRLEQFRETFRLLFGKISLTSPIATNVVVFKSDSSYKNFKPKRADGKVDTFVAGYFQSGDDVNYITLSTEGEDAQTFNIIFHEYVHFIVNTNFGKSEIPAWFNEGLAEYYETFVIQDDIRARLGVPNWRHVAFLRQNELMPLRTLFNTSNYQLHQTGDHSRSIFYAESWALMHYLIQSGKTEGLDRFLNFLLNDVPPEKAFQDAFQISYQQMESDLRKYITGDKYFYREFTFKNKLLFDADMQASPLDESGSNAYLGDLLFHTNRADDAEPFLTAALKLQPDSSLANISLGLVRIKQRKFDEAKQHLEKAIAGDPKNHLAYYRYAYLLSREARDEFGYVRAFDKQTSTKMREVLRKAILLNPAFTESYDLLAYLDLVTVEELEDAAASMRKAMKYQPGNQSYALRLAEILSRQNKLDEANLVAEKVTRTADDPEIKSRAESLLTFIAGKKKYDEGNASSQQFNETPGNGTGDGPPKLRRGDAGQPMTEAELAKQNEEVTLRTINESLRKTASGEQRIFGRVQKIDCRSRPIIFTVKTGAETITLTSNDFDSLTLNAFDPKSGNTEVGCDANISAFNVLVTYTSTAAKGTSRGEIKAIEFVPDNFRLLTAEEISKPAVSAFDNTVATDDARRRAAIMRGIKDSLQKPAAGQIREMGYLERIECTKKEIFFHLRTATQTLRVLNSSPQSLRITLFTPDLGGMQFGCDLKVIEFPVVFIYTDKPDAKAKIVGEIVSLDFVPKSFALGD